MRTLTRALLIVNCVLLLLLIVPGSSHTLYVAEKRLGIANIIDYSWKICFIASAILSVGLFIWILVSKSKGWRKQGPTALDWALLIGWLLAIAILCLYAFMLGLAG